MAKCTDKAVKARLPITTDTSPWQQELNHMQDADTLNHIGALERTLKGVTITMMGATNTYGQELS